MSFKTPKIAIVVLAAGASKRMGTPKQLLPWGNVTLIEHVIQIAIQTTSKEVVVVLGANHDFLSDRIKQYPISILNNKGWESGLGSSISCAVNHLITLKPNVDGVLIMLADQPFIDSDFLNTMITNFEMNKDRIVATSYKEDKYGVPVLFDRVYFKELVALHDDYGAKHILKKYESQVMALTPPNINVDLDTREDYRKFFNEGLPK